MAKNEPLDIELRFGMSQDMYEELSEDFIERCYFRGVHYPNLKETYKKDPLWQEANDKMIEALKARTEIEERIRVELRNGD